MVSFRETVWVWLPKELSVFLPAFNSRVDLHNYRDTNNEAGAKRKEAEAAKAEAEAARAEAAAKRKEAEEVAVPNADLRSMPKTGRRIAFWKNDYNLTVRQLRRTVHVKWVMSVPMYLKVSETKDKVVGVINVDYVGTDLDGWLQRHSVREITIELAKTGRIAAHLW